MESINPVEDVVEFVDEQSLRARVWDRRAAGTALLSRQLGESREGGEDSGAALDALLAAVEAHRGLLSFDLGGRGSVLGRVAFPFKWLQRRLLRSYIAQQEAFNDYVLDFLRVLALDRKSEPRAQRLCDGTCTAAVEAQAPELAAVMLRHVERGSAADTGLGPISSSRGLAGLAEFFSGCHLVLGAGPGSHEIVSGVSAHGADGVVLAHCSACQAAARSLGVRVADGDLPDYLSAIARYQPDGLALVSVVERLSPEELAGLFRLLGGTLPAGSRVALVTPSLATHVRRLLHEPHSEGPFHAHSVELLAGLATASEFEVLGVTFL
jgi:hypothetical protein